MKPFTLKVGKNGFILLSDFASILDTGKVAYYSLKMKKDNTLTLKFYDKNKKLIKPEKE